MKKLPVFLFFFFLLFKFSNLEADCLNFKPGEIYDLDMKKNLAPFHWIKRSHHASGIDNPASIGLLVLFNFYHRVLSPLDGPKCPYYPTCSQFGMEAVRKYGPLWGLLMLFNRQMREYPNLLKDKWYPLVIKYGVLRAYDPPCRAYIWSKIWER